jgi:pyruvate/2-oxoglutarate dehydrogenase complex dihydrolipoamide acyltransferase (E2) component
VAIEIVMPRLGWTMETGVVAEWLKRDGDAVRAGEVIFTVESDKAMQEVEALDSGTLRIPPDAPPVGATVPVGSVLAYLYDALACLRKAARLAADERPRCRRRAGTLLAAGAQALTIGHAAPPGIVGSV